MNISELADIQLKKESRALASLLFIGFIGSACVHAVVMITPIPTLWKPVSKESDDTMEVVVDTTKPPEEKVAEIAKEPDPVAKIKEQPVDLAPPAIALAPETTTPLKEGKDAAASDNFKPLLTTGASDAKIQQGGGPIIAKDGIGSGFGNAKIPTGFVLGGKINGNPNGKKDGVLGGIINGKTNGTGTQTSTILNTPTPPTEARPPKLECLSCPKPQYRGKEGTPRVTYDIAADGTVSNVRLRQSSGDAQTDRETIEAMSKWQFNPKTIPEGGRTDVKVRVTFEESGSQFQRENDERRRRESEQLAEQQRENQQREAARSQPTPAPVNVAAPLVNTPPVINTPPVVNTPPVSEPVSAPVMNAAPPESPIAAPPVVEPASAQPPLLPPPPPPSNGK